MSNSIFSEGRSSRRRRASAVAHGHATFVTETGLSHRRRRSRRSQRAIRWAIAYTAVVAGAIIATALPNMTGRSGVAYDATVLLDGFEVIGLIWAAYFAYQAFHTERRTLKFQQESARSEQERLRQETRRRARSIAQAVHVELDSIMTAAHAVRDKGRPGVQYEGLPHPLLTRALESAELFQPRTVWCMASAIHAISGLRTAVEGYRSASRTILIRPDACPTAEARIYRHDRRGACIRRRGDWCNRGVADPTEQ